MDSPILVTGGTGTLGRLVVARLREAGTHVRVLSRQHHEAADGIEYVAGNLATGEGVELAVAGVSTILHCAGSAKGDEDKARTLMRAASRARAQHVVYISVVGADRIPVKSGIDRAMFGYFASKRAAELVIARAGVPFTTLRATQFHELSLTAAKQLARMPVIAAPRGFRFQPIDVDEVAARLVELTFGQPAGVVPDMGGPRIYSMTDLIRSYLEAVHRNRVIVAIPLPGEAAAAFRAGGNLVPGNAVGRRTWEEFLSDHVRALQNQP